MKLSPKVVIEKCEQTPNAVLSVKKSAEKSKKTPKKDNKGERDLPAHVTEHILSAIESVIQNYHPSLRFQKEDFSSDCNIESSESSANVNERNDTDKVSDIASGNLDKKSNSERSFGKSHISSDNIECNLLAETSNDSLVSPSSFSSTEHYANVEDSSLCLNTSSPPISDHSVKCNGDCGSIACVQTATDQEPSNDMECRLDSSNLGNQEIKPLVDDRQSDSGISEKLSSARSSEGSLRSSGDERPVSRSSESSRLSDNSDTPVSVPGSQAKILSLSTRSSQEGPENKHSVSPLVFNKSEPIKVWRDPVLLNSCLQNVRHVSSIQHNSMQHPNSNSQPAANSAVGYPPLGGHHSAPPPGAGVRLASPHQHSRPGTAPLPVTAPPPTSSSAQPMPFHAGMGSLTTPSAHHVQPSQFATTYGHPIMPHSHQTAAAALMMSQYGSMHPSTVELLAQQKFSPNAAYLQQVREQELLLGRERAMASEWERVERSVSFPFIDLILVQIPFCRLFLPELAV